MSFKNIDRKTCEKIFLVIVGDCLVDGGQGFQLYNNVIQDKHFWHTLDLHRDHTARDFALREKNQDSWRLWVASKLTKAFSILNDL